MAMEFYQIALERYYCRLMKVFSFKKYFIVLVLYSLKLLFYAYNDYIYNKPEQPFKLLAKDSFKI